ncbi:MAG: xanthine dehydrogenase family protein molybdopterin-binding subunit [Alphaproteobacteria bacterium]|jgi:carbon-monoxide dehydrogenase large subunit|nr:xanthine dehydrogenase family protein molybdopterin-binding subunit [Alphaproteobacteria bacterium]MDP6563717.1 xanthine dehydrogenase family protein molybdopterin-binding subunit [Alphaproteobacteria bacterium]MDP6816342.1 xanthine dehydrogenase family protein molybdopterin-binding subunit [Alphaproteobacteria bacterium]
MSANDDAATPTEKYAVGQPVSRFEDPRLLRGEGRYSDDISLPGQAHGQVLRAPVAHGIIRGIDTVPALALPGVLAVFTGEDLVAAGIGPLPCNVVPKSHDGSPLIMPDNNALAVDRVRYLGNPVALVVAETAMAAKDGAEAIELDIEELPAVPGITAAVADGAPEIWPQAPGNVCLDWRQGDFAAVEQAFAEAAHVSRLRIVNNRLVVATMEPRAAVAEYDPATGKFTLHACSQGVFGMKNALVRRILNVPPEQVRVRTYDVGGSFGMKSSVYPEYVAILHAARALGRPVKWRDERTDGFLSDQHGRDSVVEATLALDLEGNFLAARIDGLANMGAYLSTVGPNMQTNNIHKNLPGVYRTPHIAVSTRCVFTNTTPIGAYRGAGRPEANYYMERLVDLAAREMGRDPVDLRRRNLIPGTAMPFTSASGQHYDSGDFPALLEKCLELADWHGFPARRAASRSAGRLRGRGLGCYLEATAPAGKEMGGIRFETDGTISIVTGTQNYGQGHASAFAQVLAGQLGLPFERIRLCQGDSDELLVGGGTGGSRSIMASGAAIVAAAEAVVDKARHLAGHLLETASEDVVFKIDAARGGQLKVAGTDRVIGLLDLAEQSRQLDDLPDELAGGLDVALAIDTPPSSYPNGVHVCEVEIDPETGATAIVAYSIVDDFGTLVNPLLVEGQVHGGVAQGIGQALMEHAVHDENGQLLTGSFMDYALPRADQFHDIAFADHPVPATTNPLGVKGCGEAGVSGALPSVMNAIVDALAEFGVSHIDMPATPEKIWRAINKGGERH